MFKRGGCPSDILHKVKQETIVLINQHDYESVPLVKEEALSDCDILTLNNEECVVKEEMDIGPTVLQRQGVGPTLHSAQRQSLAREEYIAVKEEAYSDSDSPLRLLHEDCVVKEEMFVGPTELMPHMDIPQTNRDEKDSWRLSKFNESLYRTIEVDLNSEFNLEICLDPIDGADNANFSPAVGLHDEVEEMIGRNEATPLSKKPSNRRIWDRKNACCYCKQLVTNFSRHLMRKHKNEDEVMLYAAIDDSDLKERKRKRQDVTEALRNRGNYLYNNSVANVEGKDILPNKRVGRKGTAAADGRSAFVVCKHCLGTFKRNTFFKHLNRCKKNVDHGAQPGHKRRVISSKSLPIQPMVHGASEELKEMILPHLRNDEISDIIKHDFLILSFGAKLVKKKKELRSRKAICSKMRVLATLLRVVRNGNPEITMLEELLDPVKHEELIDSVKKMCGMADGNGDVKTASIPARLRPCLLSCVDILYSHTILDKSLAPVERDQKKKRLDDFKIMLEDNWHRVLTKRENR